MAKLPTWQASNLLKSFCSTHSAPGGLEAYYRSLGKSEGPRFPDVELGWLSVNLGTRPPRKKVFPVEQCVVAGGSGVPNFLLSLQQVSAMPLCPSPPSGSSF